MVTDVSSGREAVEQLRGGLRRTLVSESMMPGMSGLGCSAGQGDGSLPGVILVTGHGTVESAVEAMKAVPTTT